MKFRLLRFAIPLLAIGVLCSPGQSVAERVTLKQQGNAVEVTIGGKFFTTYHFDPKIAKAYLQPLRTANGVVVTRGYPVMETIPAGHEHDRGFEPHQRPLYFAHGDINGYNFWAEGLYSKYYPPTTPSNFGRMVFRKLEEVRSGASSGLIRASFDLVGPDGKTFAREDQSFTFSGGKETRMVDCIFVLHALDKPVKFGDTKEGTFAVRVAPELEATNGTMTNSEGGQGEAQVWGKRANWVNVDGTIDGQKVGIAVFDSPKSFRHPTYWHARGYGLLAANVFGLSYFLNDPKQDGSYTIPPGQSITFSYRVFIHEGDSRQAKVAEEYGEYSKHP
ncbi:PmoA family protein [Terriglobus saanensis]|uniref:Transmembrane prediction n=1 Tax=Terriglobus saanensis (strain ATCC BAA-1853 / DSM 23119 / SP1PR4) TaxID=401053 RepID=E8V2N5_TERSS|nr:PmoA family protein [Terriglobus saanensis]ADV83510.1 transmembrane prediction [Terriglobus saanensis SP1PR4]